MEYDKPFLTYEEQLALIASRGIGVPSEDRLRSMLETVGYYRLSAYVYPFRTFLPSDIQRVASPNHLRSDVMQAGVSWDHIEAFWAFDRELRLLCLDAMETIEIALRTRIASSLGQDSPFAHLDPGMLDANKCEEIGKDDLPLFQSWSKQYEKLLGQSKNEDYVSHHLVKYDGLIPIWVAVEFLDMGAIGRLFALMRKEDKNKVASQFGIHAGYLLSSWIGSLGYVRNVAAHHARLWNRILTKKPATIKPHLVGETLHHLETNEHLDKIYGSLAIMAYLIKEIRPESTWVLQLKALIQRFPDVPGFSPGPNMGFPTNWETFPLWS